MPSKPEKHGIKVGTLCDVTTLYVWNMQPYLGKTSPNALPEKQKGKRLVMDLMVGLSRHTITADNFFTSYALRMELLREKKLALVGTIRRNRTELLPQFLDVQQRQNLSSCFVFQKKMTAVSYVPKNEILLSTKHRQNTRIPKWSWATIIAKGGFDSLDKVFILLSISFAYLLLDCYHSRQIRDKESQGGIDIQLYMKSEMYSLFQETLPDSTQCQPRPDPGWPPTPSLELLQVGKNNMQGTHCVHLHIVHSLNTHKHSKTHT